MLLNDEKNIYFFVLVLKKYKKYDLIYWIQDGSFS